jgi:hypothetical protein
MYIRRVNRKNLDGSTVSYLQLAENIWDSEKQRSKVHILCTLGRADQRADDRLKQLVRSIKKTTIPDLLETGWSFQNSWEHGPLYVLEKMWKDLGIEQVIREKAGDLFERTIFLMVANRCLAPQSKLGCYERWREEIHWRGPAIELQHLYRAMDVLHDHKEKIEESLYWRLADLLNMDVDLVFYDTTSVHFEIEEEDEKLRKRGYSKNGRTDAPQMVVGMAVTRDGFPVKSWVFPGNTTDVTTIEQVKNDLKGWRLNRCIFVADAGMVSADNLASLRRGGGRYIVAMPWRKGTEADEAASHPGRFKEVRENLHVKEVRVGDRRYVVCFNPKEAERQRLHREEILRDLTEELRGLREHPKRACQLMASKRYGRYLRRLKSGELRLNQASIQERERHDGIWIVHSNADELSAEDLALAYKQLLRVEECWRTMKSTIEIRPVFHHSPDRIRAHTFLCVLALLLERVAEKACGTTWFRIREELRSIKIGQLFGPQGTVYQVTPGTSEARNLLKKLKIDPLPSVLAVQ